MTSSIDVCKLKTFNLNLRIKVRENEGWKELIQSERVSE